MLVEKRRQDNKDSFKLMLNCMNFTIITIIKLKLIGTFVVIMETNIPVIENCSISEIPNKNFFSMPLDAYILKNRDMVFPHRHSFFHFVLFTSGTGNFSIDFTNFTINPFCMYFMAPGQVHTWDFEGVPEGYVVNFSWDFFDDFLLRNTLINDLPIFQEIPNQQVVTIPEDKRDIVLHIFEELQVLATPLIQDEEQYLQVLLLHLLYLATLPQRQTIKVRSPWNADQKIAKQFKQEIEKHYKQEKYPSFYAKRLGISTNHLNNVCKTYFGKQAGELIRERIILEAKRLLIEPQVRITNISEMFQFNDNSYFTKFFKKAVGVTPEEFRQKNIKK